MSDPPTADRAVDLPAGRGLVLMQAVAVVMLAFLGAVVVGNAGRLAVVAAGVGEGHRLHRVATTAAQFLGLGLGVAGYVVASGDRDLLAGRVGVPSGRDVVYALATLVGLVVASAAVGAAIDQLGVDVAQNRAVAEGREDPTLFLYLIPVTVLLVGPFEELVFRGAAQGLLRRAWGPAAAVGVASAMFGIVHWLALTGGGSRLWYVAVAALLGCLLGAAYERTGNLVVPAFAHGSYNALLFGAQYLVATGAV